MAELRVFDPVAFFCLAIAFFGTVVGLLVLATAPAAASPWKAVAQAPVFLGVSLAAVACQTRRERRTANPGAWLEWKGRGRFPLWLFYACLLLPLSLAGVVNFAATHLVLKGLEAWRPSPSRDAYWWVFFVCFVAIMVPLWLFLNNRFVKAIGIWFPSYGKAAATLDLLRSVETQSESADAANRVAPTSGRTPPPGDS